jgi:hypothetical protein
MQTDFEQLFHQAEHHYLQKPELNLFKQQIGVMKERLATYETLREQEIPIFQAVADRLEMAFERENPRTLERALKHWVSALRYCGMAMLLNNPEHLQHRLLEWLTDQIQAYNIVEIERSTYNFLESELKQTLDEKQYTLVKPFLEQCKANLLSANAPQPVS